MSVLWKQSAVDVVGLLRSGEISPVEAVQAAIARIEAVDGKTNALPIHCFDRAIERAETLDLASHRQNPKSLCGLPIAVKDYNDVAGDWLGPVLQHVQLHVRPTVRQYLRTIFLNAQMSPSPCWKRMAPTRLPSPMCRNGRVVTPLIR